MCALKLNPMVDPRGIQSRGRISLAHRQNLSELKKGPILFYNNTKLEFCNYTEIFPTIKKYLKSKGIANFIDIRKTVRGKTTEDFRNTAKALVDKRFKAAIVALADMGTTPATVILTIELERAGIPSVLITAPPGNKLAEVVTFYRAGPLCLCPIDIYQASSKNDVVSEVEKQIDCIIDSLTLPPDELTKRHSIKLNIDSVSPSDEIFLYKSVLLEDNNVEPGLLIEEVMDKFDAEHIGDGLPLIPPTKNRVSAMMSYCPFNPEEVLVNEVGPSGKNITIKDIVVNAVMAGCKPEYLPILITVFRALSNPKYNFLQSVTTSHPGGNLVLVSGPIAQEVGIHGGQGCLGPGFRANATIGRAVNLVIINVTRSVPGISDLDCLASPSEYTYCFSEDPSLSPWPLIHEERFDKETSVVYVLKASPPIDVIDFLSQSARDLLDTFIDSSTNLGSNNAYIPGNLILVLTPDHSKILDKEDWNKQKLRLYFYEKIRQEKSKVEGRGIMPVRPPGFNELDTIPVTRKPDDIEIVVAGGRGGHSAIITPWALRSEAIVEPICLPDGNIAKSIKEFKV
ncbi:MAG: hypothetical protein GXP33_05270 [Spirochaetes bacterium]|nr:hypothetical protein [Spirochaetota bacterium]